MIEQLQNRYAVEWPALHGLVWSHREACMAAALRAVDHPLSDPMAMRNSVRTQIEGGAVPDHGLGAGG